MSQIPDAPWIREAERDGFGDPEPVECPCCAWINCKYIYVTNSGETIGCDHCVKRMDAYEWRDEQEAEHIGWDDER